MWLKCFLISILLLVVSCAGSATVQGSVAQGELSFDGNFRRPPAESFITMPHWHYSFTRPLSGDWMLPGGAMDGLWFEGEGSVSFNQGNIEPGDNLNSTTWPRGASELRIRGYFYGSAFAVDELMFWARWNEDITVFVNGIEAVEKRGHTPSHRYLGLSDEARSHIDPNGNNVIAIHVRSDSTDKRLSFNLVREQKMAHLPVQSSTQSQYFQPITDYVREQMSVYGVSAGTIAIAIREGDKVEVPLSAGIGYMTKDFMRPVPSDVVFRLASLDKPPTARVAQLMIDNKVLNPATGAPLRKDTKVFPMLSALGLRTFGNDIVDSSINDITIQDLIDHKARLPPIPGDEEIYQSLSAQGGQITTTDHMRWLYGQKRLRKPKGYSNSGYDVLRYMIDKVAPGGLEAYFEEALYGNSDGAMYIAGGPVTERVRTADGRLNEPWYTTLSDDDDGVTLGSRGVLAASAESYARYMLQHPSSPGLYYGAFPGVQTFTDKFHNKHGEIVNVTAMFNMQNAIPFREMIDGEVVAENLDGMLRRMVESLPPQAWRE